MKIDFNRIGLSFIFVATLITTIPINADEEIQLESISLEEGGEEDIDLKTAKKIQAKSGSELLKYDSAIDVAGGSANAKRFYIRGISEALTNITVDGAKQSKDLHQHRGGLANIDTELLKSVEVDAGVATADAGAGNLGGSVKFETVDAQDLLKDGQNVGAFIKTGFGSVNDSYKNSIGVYGAAHNVGILVYGSRSDSDDYETGSGRTVYGSAEDMDDYLVKLSILNISNHTLKLSFEKNTQEGLYQAGGAGSDMGYHDPDGTRELERQRVQRKTTALNYGYNPDNPFINVGAKLYKNDTALEYLERTSDSTVDAKGVGFDIRNTFSFITKIFQNDLTVGVDYEEEEGTSSNGSVTSENRGLFLQNRMKFERFNLSFGARYDDFENDLIYKKSGDEDISANVNGEYFLTHSWSLFAGYGEAVSGSNTIPIGWLSNIDPNLTFNGSEDEKLKPQRAKKFEVGTSYERSNLFQESDFFKVKITLFDTKIEDPIVVGTGGRRGAPVSDIVNEEDIESKGIELKTIYRWDNLETSLAYTHTDVEQGGEDLVGTTKRLAGSYGDKIVADLTYTPSANLMFGYTIIGVMNNKDAADDVNNAAGYAVHSIQASYTPQSFKNLTLSFAVNNLFDKEYAAQTSLTSNGEAVGEPGRDVRFGLKYIF